MEIRTLARQPVRDPSEVYEARRIAAGLARAAGLDENELGKLGIIVTEAATNLVKHATDGELVFSSVRVGDRRGFSVLSLDRGPGIRNLSASLVDGYSTSGSPGTGLGAIRRLASLFDIYSSDSGTVLLAAVWAGSPPRYPSIVLELGAVAVPKPGEDVCGDAWSARRTGPSIQILVADGLGHGMDASEAAAAAVRAFHETPGEPARVIEAIHGALFHTRGAAVALTEIDTAARAVRFAGVGNICGTIIGPGRNYSMVSHNGTAGLEARNIREFSYPWPESGVLVLNTDGISSWKLEEASGILSRHPMIIAGLLYSDFRRERDDATVVVARDAAPGGSR